MSYWRLKSMRNEPCTYPSSLRPHTLVPGHAPPSHDPWRWAQPPCLRDRSWRQSTARLALRAGIAPSTPGGESYPCQSSLLPPAPAHTCPSATHHAFQNQCVRVCVLCVCVVCVCVCVCVSPNDMNPSNIYVSLYIYIIRYSKYHIGIYTYTYIYINIRQSPDLQEP